MSLVHGEAQRAFAVRDAQPVRHDIADELRAAQQFAERGRLEIAVGVLGNRLQFLLAHNGRVENARWYEDAGGRQFSDRRTHDEAIERLAQASG